MLVPVATDTVDALLQGVTDRPLAPGWPHDDTATALGFLHHGGVQFLIVDDEGRIAGECGTKTAPRADGSVEIGYGLAAHSRGHGLGSRAVTELVGWLCHQPGVTVIEAEVHVSNTPSRRIVERLGFTADAPATAGYLRYRRMAQSGSP
ncbi:MAG TPA: GNAT family N-acetyltransferase [Mycobacteriales bacterium]|nr:GNAT family N-acetyltransferase [Mycobacteriales bacterium]